MSMEERGPLLGNFFTDYCDYVVDIFVRCSEIREGQISDVYFLHIRKKFTLRFLSVHST